MSESAQAIFYFVAMLCFIAGALLPLRANRSLLGLDIGWAGAALIAFVLFYIAIKAS